MRSLIKYEIRKSLFPFVILMFLNVIWWIFNMLNINGNINKIVQYIVEIGSFIIVIYSIKEINDEFDEEKNIIGFQLPVKGWKRFLSKYAMFCAAYSVIMVLNVIAALYNKEHLYSIMYNQITKPNQYIVYVILSKCISYFSGMMVVAFVIMLGSYVTERLGIQSIQSIVSMLMFVGILTVILLVSMKDPSALNSFSQVFSFKFLLKPGLNEVRYTIPMHILFLPVGTVGSMGGLIIERQNDILPSVSILPMIVNMLITIFLYPFVVKLSEYS